MPQVPEIHDIFQIAQSLPKQTIQTCAAPVAAAAGRCWSGGRAVAGPPRLQYDRPTEKNSNKLMQIQIIRVPPH